MRGVVDMVAAEMISASATAPARSVLARIVTPGRLTLAATASARAGVRFQTRTRWIGRTVQYASISGNAIAPAPNINNVEASLRARYVAANAEFAAVLRSVIAAPSMAATGMPFVPSNR